MDRKEEPRGPDPNISEPAQGSETSSAAAQTPGSTKLPDSSQVEEPKDSSKEEEEEEEEEGGMSPSAQQEPSTLVWSGHLNRKTLLEQEGGGSERGEVEVTDRSRWRESMPEGERWRDEELRGPLDYKEDCWLADDEEEDEEEDRQPALEFTPRVTVVNQNQNPEEICRLPDKEVELPAKLSREEPFQPECWEENDKLYLCDHVDREKLGSVFSVLAGVFLFPLLVWGGYALLPFDPPVLGSPPLRVVYTLRCAFFAAVPVVFGMLVKGVARLRYSALKPLYLNGQVDREVMVHEHYVSESLVLFLFYFLQLAVLASYLSQDLVKLVPLLTIVFVFGRLIYWLCLALGSSIRGLGFAFSFLPMLVMMGANLYYMCSSDGQDAIFDVAVPTTPPPPRLRWWF